MLKALNETYADQGIQYEMPEFTTTINWNVQWQPVDDNALHQRAAEIAELYAERAEEALKKPLPLTTEQMLSEDNHFMDIDEGEERKEEVHHEEEEVRVITAIATVTSHEPGTVGAYILQTLSEFRAILHPLDPISSTATYELLHRLKIIEPGSSPGNSKVRALAESLEQLKI